MPKNTTTTNAPTPTKQQAMLIRLATRPQGVIRAEVRKALGYDNDVNLPVQTMLKKIGNRFGLTLKAVLVEGDGSDNRKIAEYRFLTPKPKALAIAVSKAPAKKAKKAAGKKARG
jgi:hypothetical protein